MLGLVVSFLLICLLGSIEAASLNQPAGFEVLMEDYLESKCMKNADHAAFLRLILNGRGMMVAAQRKSVITTDEGTYNSTCHPSWGYEELKSLMAALEPCLDVEEKYFPDFLLTTYNTSREDLCKGGKDNFIAMMTDLKNADCALTRRNLELLGRSCLADVMGDTDFDLNSDFSLTKDFLCEKLEVGRDCLVKGLRHFCIDDAFPDFLMRGFQPYLDWCAKH